MGMMLSTTDVEKKRHGGTTQFEQNIAFFAYVREGTPSDDVGTATQTQPTIAPTKPKILISDANFDPRLEIFIGKQSTRTWSE